MTINVIASSAYEMSRVGRKDLLRRPLANCFLRSRARACCAWRDRRCFIKGKRRYSLNCSTKLRRKSMGVPQKEKSRVKKKKKKYVLHWNEFSRGSLTAQLCVWQRRIGFFCSFMLQKCGDIVRWIPFAPFKKLPPSFKFPRNLYATPVLWHSEIFVVI